MMELKSVFGSCRSLLCWILFFLRIVNECFKEKGDLGSSPKGMTSRDGDKS